MLCAVAISVLSINSAFAQYDKRKTPPPPPPPPPPPKTDKTPKTDKSKTTVVDFGRGGATTEIAVDKSGSAKNTAEYSNIIWVEATSVILGYVNVGYERAINDNFSVEVAGGVSFQGPTNSFRESFAKALFQPKVVSDNYWGSRQVRIARATSLLAEDVPGNSAQLGTYFLIEPKYFTKGDFLNGFFIGLRLQSIGYSANAPKPDIAASNRSGQVEYSTTETLLLTRSNIDVVPHIGWHRQSGRIMFDYEAGIGARFASLKGYQVGVSTVPGTLTQNYELNDSFLESMVVPTFSAAFKLGYAF